MRRLLTAAAFTLLSATARAEPVNLVCTGKLQWMKAGKPETTEQHVFLIEVDAANKKIVSEDARIKSDLAAEYDRTGQQLSFSSDDGALLITTGSIDRITGRLFYYVTERRALMKHLNNANTADPARLLAEREALTLFKYDGYCKPAARMF